MSKKRTLRNSLYLIYLVGPTVFPPIYDFFLKQLCRIPAIEIKKIQLCLYLIKYLCSNNICFKSKEEYIHKCQRCEKCWYILI